MIARTEVQLFMECKVPREGVTKEFDFTVCLILMQASAKKSKYLHNNTLAHGTVTN